MKNKKRFWPPTLPASEMHVDAAERDLGAKLPGEYRVRLMASNGGEIVTARHEWQVFPVLDPTDEDTAKRSADHIVLENEKARALQGFPKGAVAIASNGEGDYLVFLPARVSGRLEPQVQVWNHETGKCKPSPLKYD